MNYTTLERLLEQCILFELEGICGTKCYSPLTIVMHAQ